MLAKGAFDRRVDDNGIEVWVSQVGLFANINTAFIDRATETVVIVDPHSANKWLSALENENLKPTHVIVTHTHRDHVAGVKKLLKKVPGVELIGHVDSNYPNILSRVLFQHQKYTQTWTHKEHTIEKWQAGGITLHVTHSPGHAPGHLTFHGHGVYHAGDLLFTARSGRVDLPGGDAETQWRSISHAREILQSLPQEWWMVPGHNYQWIDGTTPNWVTVADALAHNQALNSPTLEDFDNLDFLRFDDDLAA